MSDKLKPCPFFKDGIPKHRKSQYGHTIEVVDPKTRYDDIYYNIPYYKTKEEAIKVWNTRADLVIPDKENEILRRDHDMQKEYLKSLSTKEPHKIESLDILKAMAERDLQLITDAAKAYTKHEEIIKLLEGGGYVLMPIKEIPTKELKEIITDSEPLDVMSDFPDEVLDVLKIVYKAMISERPKIGGE